MFYFRVRCPGLVVIGLSQSPLGTAILNGKMHILYALPLPSLPDKKPLMNRKEFSTPHVPSLSPTSFPAHGATHGTAFIGCFFFLLLLVHTALGAPPRPGWKVAYHTGRTHTMAVRWNCENGGKICGSANLEWLDIGFFAAVERTKRGN